MDRAHLAYAACALCATAVLVLVGARMLDRALARRRARKRHRRALQGERDAEILLERLGYTIEARQAPAQWTIAVDGEDHEVALRADLIVSRGSARYVAEVKTGRAAPRLSTASTRRQLLEYWVAYDVDGVLLVDAETQRVLRVAFPMSAAGTPPVSRLALASTLVAGMGLGAAAAYWLGG